MWPLKCRFVLDISTTKKSYLSMSTSSAKTATPMFPQAIALWHVAFKMCAVSAVVVLLPFVPVIAMIFLSFLSLLC